MSEYSVTYDSCMEAARLASSRGDHLGAQQALMAAITAAGMTGSRAQQAGALIRLGELKRDAGSLAEAEEVFHRALEVSESIQGDDDASLIPALTNLAGTRAVRGAPEEAEKLLTRALMLAERRLGREHPDLVVLLNDLSRLYLKRSAFGLAEPLLHRLHAIKRLKGEDHAEVATVLASLATVRQALGDHDGAEQLWRRVLAIRERTLAPNHFAIATAVESLAETCSARGKVAEALRLFHRALGMREMTLGLAHPSLRTLRERIADLQLQGSDEFTGEETIPFVAPPAPVRIPPAAVYPTVEMPSVPAVVRAAPTDPVPAPAVAQAIAPVAAPATVAPAVLAALAGSIERPPEQLQRPAAAVAAPEPVVYAQPATPELEVPVWSQAEPASSAAAMTRTPQLMSIILPAPSDLELDDDERDDADYDYAMAQGRMQRMAASLRSIFQHRQAQMVAAGAVAVALIVVVAATASQPRGSSDDTFSRAIPAQQYVAGGSTALGDNLRAAPGDSAVIAPPAPASRRESTSPSGMTERSRADAAAAERAPARPAQPVNDAPAPPRLPDAPRTLPGLATAQLDSTMRAAAPGQISLGPAVEKPGFEGSIGAVDYTDRLALRTPVLIGDVPQIPYPQSLRSNGREIGGEVVVEFSVDTLGRPDMSTARVIRSNHELMTGAVYKVIPGMRFIPGTISGKKMVSKVQMPFSFTVKKD